MTLADKVTQFNADADIAHEIIHGDAMTTVTTENGGVRSLAKLIADSAAEIADQATFSVVQKADYASLRAYAGISKTIFVTGYLVSAAPAGISGTFVRDDSDTTSADNGGTIIVATSGKRWKRVYSGDVYPTWWGADPTGAVASTAAFAAALLFPNVAILPGLYTIAGILFPINNQTIRGIGNPVIQKIAADAGAHTLFFMSSKTDIKIDGITMDGNGAAQTAWASSGKAVMEIWNQSKRITISNCTIRNGYKWGSLVKGNSTDGIPQNIKFNNINTSGALGQLGNVLGADGESGFVVVAGDVKVTNSQFEDRVDLEVTTALQTLHAMFSNCSFFKQFDSGVNNATGSLAVSNCTFYATTGIISARTYGGTWTGCIFTNKYQGVTLAAAWYGIIILGNNNYGTHITGCQFQGATIGIGAVSPTNVNISDCQIDCQATALGSIVEDSQTIAHGGIVFGATGPVRGVGMKGNSVTVTAAFNTAGGIGINSPCTDVRGISAVGNTVQTDAFGVGKMHVAVARAYSAVIRSNAASVTTNLSGANLVESYESARFVLTGADRVAAPAGGTFTAGDAANISNGRSALSPTEAYSRWYYTTDAGWKRTGEIT